MFDLHAHVTEADAIVDVFSLMQFAPNMLELDARVAEAITIVTYYV